MTTEERANFHIVPAYGQGPMHPYDCPACVKLAADRKAYRATRNPHRPGTKAADRWDRDRAFLDWAGDLRGETYWSS